MKRSFFLLCAVLFVLGSLLPLAGYRLAKTVLGPSEPASSAAAPEPETPDAASLPPSDRDSETFLIADQGDGAVVSVPRRVLFIADDVTNVGQACQHTGAIRIAQAALDPQPLTGLRVDVVVGNVLFAECLHRLRVQRCHFCMLIVHAQIPLSVSNFLYLSLPSALMAHVYHSAFVK